MSKFYEETFGCFTDICSCCLGCYYPLCLQAFAVGKSAPHESWVLPLILNLYCNICLIGPVINRMTIRKNLGIEGTCFNDYCMWCWCCCCSACQEYREVSKRYQDHVRDKESSMKLTYG